MGTWTIKISVLILVSVGAFAAGRYATPEKVRIETRVVEVMSQKKDMDTNQNKKKTKTTTRITKPGGEIDETVVETEESEKKTDITKIVSGHKDSGQLEVKAFDSKKLHLSGLVGIDFTKGQPLYGASITKPILGPVTMGLWGLNNMNCGMSMGVSF